VLGGLRQPGSGIRRHPAHAPRPHGLLDGGGHGLFGLIEIPEPCGQRRHDPPGLFPDDAREQTIGCRGRGPAGSGIRFRHCSNWL